MQRIMLKSKLHQAVITEADLTYEGSLSIDSDLMEQSDIIENEKVAVYNINNGQRFETYAITGKKGSGVIGLNGAAARMGEVGDRVIIVTYCNVDEGEVAEHKPKVLVLDDNNNVKYTK
jgi:aspartate 1-decarboxylase